MAQRQRAGLITPRSQDRNLIPVTTDVAQRQSVGLITLGSHDRNMSSVPKHFNRCGAAEARGAHNPEVVRSKRTAGKNQQIKIGG